MIVGLPELKVHLRVDGSEEDMLIEACSEAAEEQVRGWLGRPVYEHESQMPLPGTAGHDPNQIVANAAIKIAVMMLAERLYSNRGGEGSGADNAVPPMSVRALLASLRVFYTLPSPPLILDDL